MKENGQFSNHPGRSITFRLLNMQQENGEEEKGMAVYRAIQIAFWSDPKVDDCFTPEDKYFYLYLLTNPHTNICGCYEIGSRQLERETGYSEETVERLLGRMQNVHDVIRYDPETKEILLLNWWKYNWTKSAHLIKAVKENLAHVKNDSFKEYLLQRLHCSKEAGTLPDCEITVPIPYTDPVGTSVAVADTESGSDTYSDSAAGSCYPKSEKEFLTFCRDHEIREEFGESIYERYAANGWTMENGEPVRNWRNVILSAWRNEKKQPAKKTPENAAVDTMAAIRARRKREQENSYTVLDVEKELNRKEDRACG